jgi:hypothetical protein
VRMSKSDSEKGDLENNSKRIGADAKSEGI